MGQEIQSLRFSEQDEKEFHLKLREETKILKRWFDTKAFQDEDCLCGLELEAWLLTQDFVPAPHSDVLIEGLKNPLVVPEVSRFNFELNSHPQKITGKVFSNLEKHILDIWKPCEDFAEKNQQKALLIGTLPTLRDHMLTMDNLSPQKRYFALNERIMKMHGNTPMKLSFQGVDEVYIEHGDLLTECAATSLQVHFGVTQDTAVKYYNASIVASAFVAAVAANSPFFYGKELWDESRIPIFEQSVNLKSFRRRDGVSASRVSLGNGYVRNSLLELFIENLDGYPAILPELSDSGAEWLNHLRLHNGTIWRWNRPLIGLSDQGKPSLRLEFRVPSSGPTVKDAIANMTFQIALVEFLFQQESLEEKISFEDACHNFYQACQKGFDAEVKWTDGQSHNIQKLLLEIFPKIVDTIESRGIDKEDTYHYLEKVIKGRLVSGQNGANWQKGFIHTHGKRFQEMLEKYYQFQRSNTPVHEWTV